MTPNAARLTRPLQQTRVTLPIKTRWIAASLFLFTLLLYLPTLRNEFVNFDDPAYISNNSHVSSGITPDNLKWAFTTLYNCNWHPLTWLSHQLDAEMFANHPAGPHFVNALMHAANALLLFLFLEGATTKRWPSAVCAALFAWHPLRVESVAWAAERKDVLCAFFFFLTLLCYLRSVRRSSIFWFSTALVCYALGLMAKPMIVTLPCLLILLDFWPLRRWSALTKSSFASLGLEKVPFLLLTVPSCLVTYAAQLASGAVMGDKFTPGQRIANSCVSYVRYLRAIFLPTNLAVFYPLPPHWPAWEVAGSAFLLVTITALTIWQARLRPFLIVGWFWFCGLLVPAIGLVQVGSQSIADRYTYLPSIGITMAICWMADEVVLRSAIDRRTLGLAAGGILAVLAAMTLGQIGYWHDDYSLFLHANSAVAGNWVAEGHIADALTKEQDFEGAEAHSRLSLQFHPIKFARKEAEGDLFAKRGEYEAADGQYETAMLIDPNHVQLRRKWGDVLVALGRFDQAIDQYALYLAANPSDADVHFSLAIAMLGKHDLAGATAELVRCVALNPASAKAEASLGRVLVMRGDSRGAAAHYQRALALDPNLDSAQKGLAEARARTQQGLP